MIDTGKFTAFANDMEKGQIETLCELKSAETLERLIFVPRNKVLKNSAQYQAAIPGPAFVREVYHAGKGQPWAFDHAASAVYSTAAELCADKAVPAKFKEDVLKRETLPGVKEMLKEAEKPVAKAGAGAGTRAPDAAAVAAKRREDARKALAADVEGFEQLPEAEREALVDEWLKEEDAKASEPKAPKCATGGKGKK